MDFGNILQAADKHARSGRRVKKTSRTDSRYLQGFLHGRYHRFRCVKGCESGVFEALDVCLVFFPVFGILTQQFMQQSDLGKQFPVCRSSFNVRVFFRRIQDALQSSETRITVQNLASLFRETKLRAHEYQFKCGYVVRQMLSFVICHIVLYKIV